MKNTNYQQGVDKNLWDKFLKGDRDAYEFIYKQFVNVLFSYGLRFTSDRELVKDCIHDVFVKINQNRNKLAHTDNIKAYLFVIMKNILTNVLKRKNVQVDFLNITSFPEKVDRTVEEEYLEKEDSELTEKKVQHIFSLLPSKQKEILYLRFIEGLTIHEISMHMDMNYQSVLNSIQRSIKKIKESSIKKGSS